MEIKEITDRSIWQRFFEENGSTSFLQSWEWGEVQKSLNYGVLRVGVFDKNNLKAIAQIIKIESRRGNFLFIPHGPIFLQMEKGKTKLKTYIEKIKNYLITIAKKEKYSFIRIAPIIEDNQNNRKMFENLLFKTAPIYMHAERTWVLDLNKTEQELLNNMRKTTRYLIRRADRDGVVIEERSDQKAFDIFWRIYKETAEREKFVPYSFKYIKSEFEEFNRTNRALFLFGKVAGEYYASALILFTKSSGFYHQGASIHTKFPVTYRLQWEAILWAKKRGCSLYNFWGIKQEGRTPKDWDGLTLFKTGFGGRQIDYIPTQDYIISPKYYLTYLYEKYLAWKRKI
jgi:lipid II:glycine glycyltransferase (peptidoglycan interpeptide bridge formation enzyme)